LKYLYNYFYEKRAEFNSIKTEMMQKTHSIMLPVLKVRGKEYFLLTGNSRLTPLCVHMSPNMWLDMPTQKLSE